MKGEDLLNELVAEDKAKVYEELKNVLRGTISGIREREQWIKTRQIQIEMLKQVQIDAVKAFDDGTIDLKKINGRINHIRHLTNNSTTIADEREEDDTPLPRSSGRKSY